MELFRVSVALAILAAEIGLPDGYSLDGDSLDGGEVQVTVLLSSFVCTLCLDEKANDHVGWQIWIWIGNENENVRKLVS